MTDHRRPLGTGPTDSDSPAGEAPRAPLAAERLPSTPIPRGTPRGTPLHRRPLGTGTDPD
ncbi:hypothetical protein [Streptomyces axinellae]|uniref:Uncharacterized protein n=1 Tax=Streptomyces axinellae TaxID=552788 RepID=A0ABP6DAQ1_9ACTN